MKQVLLLSPFFRWAHQDTEGTEMKKLTQGHTARKWPGWLQTHPGWLSPARNLHARLKRRSQEKQGLLTFPQLERHCVELQLSTCWLSVLLCSTWEPRRVVVVLQSGDLNGVCGMSSSRAAVCSLFGTSDQFLEQKFSIDLGRVGMVWGWFKCITFIVHFISILIASAPLQIIRPSIPEVGDPCSRGLLCGCPVWVSGCINETNLVSLVTFYCSFFFCISAIICLSTCLRTQETDRRHIIYMKFKTGQS